MSRGDLILWVIIPYVCLTVFVVGHVWRYRRDQLTWTTRSTQLLERKLLRPGILMFHWGLVAVLAGHILGILIPKSATESVGMSENLYHLVSVSAGTASGVAMTVGLLILALRRSTVPRVAATTNGRDRLAYTLLLIVVLTGMYATVGENLLGSGYDYRETVGPWFRSLFILDPDAGLMSGIPLIYQLHALTAWLLFAVWPFTRLVHAWSVPIAYVARKPILYRSRVPKRAQPSGVELS